jgi:hypothetical protein
MSNLPVDKDSDYMRKMWETNKTPTQRVLQEVMHDYAPKHDLKKQTELHEKIRNDSDYDDWDYGTEPNYGSSWK